MAKYLTDRQDRKLSQIIRKVDGSGRTPPGQRIAAGMFGSPGTDFGTPIVAKTTIPAATRVVGPGSDTFTPGQGTAYLFKVGSGGDLTPWLDSDGTIIVKTVFNFSEEEYLPNVPEVTTLTTMAGTAFETMAGTPFLGMSDGSSTTDYIGPNTAVPIATMDRTGRLVIPPTATPPQQLRLQRAIVSESGGINPDSHGDIWLFVDGQLDSTAQAGSTTANIVLASSASTTNGFYDDWVVRNIATGESRWIKSYVGSSRTATIGAFGDVSYPWVTAPQAGDPYKLEQLFIVEGHWNQAEATGRVLFQYEECFVQPIRGHANQYTIVRGADKILLRAVVDESGGIPPNTQGAIILSDSTRTTTGLWDWMHADKYIDRFAQIVVQYEKTIPVGGPTIDEGRIYRIMGADCSALTDSPP